MRHKPTNSKIIAFGFSAPLLNDFLIGKESFMKNTCVAIKATRSDRRKKKFTLDTHKPT